MKKLNVRKNLMMLAMVNTFILSAVPSNTSYAIDSMEVDISEFEDIEDIVVAKDELVAIKDKPGRGYGLLGVLEPGECLKLICDVENDYEVLYRGKLGYVNKNYVTVSTVNELNKTDIDSKNTVVARELTEIKKEPTDKSETLGKLRPKESLIVSGRRDGYYEVKYHGEKAYVLDTAVEFRNAFIKSGYIKENTNVYDSVELNNKIADLPKLEFVRIYGETENSYYIDNNGISGYINKDSVSLLNGIYIVTDISDQIVEMYKENELLLSSAVVTGKPPKHSTPTGVFYIGDEDNEVTDHRELVGDDYRYYVQYMMTFVGNRGIGFHSSEKGYDDRGRYFGSRTADEYGGDTYLIKGSHACVNMPNKAAEEMYYVVEEYVVEDGNLVKVLVKE